MSALAQAAYVAVPEAITDPAEALILRQDGSPTWRYHVGPFQEAIRTSGLDYTTIGARAGMDSSYLTRVVGLREYTTGPKKNGKTYRQRARTINYENACRLALALKLDLVEWSI